MNSVRLWRHDALGPTYRLIETEDGNRKIVFEKDTLLNFPKSGFVCRLSPSECVVSQEAIGLFELKMVVPVTAQQEWKRIEPFMLVSVFMPITPVGEQNKKANNGQIGYADTISEQFFRIYKIQHEPLQVTVYAEHISYDCGNAVTKSNFFASNDFGEGLDDSLNGESVHAMIDKANARELPIKTLDDACYTPIPCNIDSTQIMYLHEKADDAVDAFAVMNYSGDLGLRSIQRVLFDDDGLLKNAWLSHVAPGVGKRTDSYGLIRFVWQGIDLHNLHFMCVRDNHDLRIRLYDETGTHKYFGYNGNYTIRYGRNMQAVKWTIDVGETVNTVVPYVHDGSGNTTEPNDIGPVIPGITYHLFQPFNVMQPHITYSFLPDGVVDNAKYGYDRHSDAGHGGCWAEGSMVYNGSVLFDKKGKIAQPLRVRPYDAQAFQAGAYGQNNWNAAAFAGCLRQFDKGCATPKISVDVDFRLLGDTEEYRDARRLENVWLWSQVRVIYPQCGYDEMLQVVSIEWDCLTQQYISMKIGSIYNPIEPDLEF